jgi:hypothetical protein
MTLPLIAIVLSMWVIVGIGVAIFMITPRQGLAQWFNVTARRRPEKPTELRDLPPRLTMPPPAAEPPPAPAKPTSRDRT